MLRFILRVLSYVSLSFYFRIGPKPVCGVNDNKKQLIIVSLTSFPARINTVWLAIESLIRQKVKPDKIILWLSLEQFSELSNLPKRLRKLRSRGLEIEFVEDDLRAHKKYYYVLQRYPNDIIITVDDDLLYDSKTISRLVDYHLEFPNAVISNYGYKITIDSNGQIAPYKKWLRNKTFQRPSYDNFFGSGGGTLFPPDTLHPEAFNKNSIKKLSLLADDIWLNSMCRMNDRKVLQVNGLTIFNILFTKKQTLSAINVGQDMNDQQLAAVRKHCIENLGYDPYIKMIAKGF